MKKEILFPVAFAVLAFMAFELSGLSEVRLIAFGLSLVHLKHLCGVSCGLYKKIMGV